MNGQRSNWILNFLLMFLVLALGLGIVPAFLGAVNPDFQNTWYGFRPYIVLSDSMEPTIMTGALVIGRVTPFAELELDDIITFEMMFNGEPVLNTHRIVERNADHLRTQGDNPAITMPDADSVHQDNFRYRVVWYSNTIQLGDARGLLLFIVLPAGALLLVVIGLVALVSIVRRKRNNVVPLALPEYPMGEEHEQQFVQQRDLQVPPSEWLHAQTLPVQKDEEDEHDDGLYGLIENTIGPPQAGMDDDDEILATLDHVLATHQKKEEHEWFDKLMRQKGIVLPR